MDLNVTAVVVILVQLSVRRVDVSHFKPARLLWSEFSVIKPGVRGSKLTGFGHANSVCPLQK